MFSLLKRKQNQNRCLGVSFHQDGISVALTSINRQKVISLDHLEFLSVDNSEDIASEIKKLVSKLGVKNIPVVFVMDHKHYTLLQVEVPEVSNEEMRNAVRWRIKDLIDYHIDDAVIDLIMLPQSKRAGSPKLMYVVTARAAYIQKTIDQLEAAGVEINAIDVAELALRNMTFADAEESRAEAMLYLSRNLSLIEVCDNGCLFLSRHLNVDTNRLGDDNRMEMMDMLSLEVQRSMDYFESQFAYGAAAKLHVVSENLSAVDDFKEVASSYLTVPVERLSALETIKGIDAYDQQLVATCLPTIGGAIRDYVWKN